jgi:hypothetical protein
MSARSEQRSDEEIWRAGADAQPHASSRGRFLLALALVAVIAALAIAGWLLARHA